MKSITHIICASLITLAVTSCGVTAEDSPQAQGPIPSNSGKLNRTFSTKIGINPFPYDMTTKAVQDVAKLTRNNGDLYALQLDNGIPWQEALDGKPFSSAIKKEWQRTRDQHASHQAFYLAIAPLQDDRKNWATAYEGSKAPKWVRNSKGLTPQIQQAYINYVMRAVEYFQPDYINIGMEAMDLAHNEPKQWAGMEKLFIETRKEIKSGYRDIPVGMSVGLPLLMLDDVHHRLKGLIDASDYVGLSFYPHLKQFYDVIGGASIPSHAPDQWRGPLQWAHENIDKPLALCETAYSSEDVKVKRWGLNMPSNADSQAMYVEDLAKIAKRDNYLFVMFFLGIDYDALAKKINDPMSILPLWQKTGFIDQHLQPKPAWNSYQRAWLNRTVESPAASTAVPQPIQKSNTATDTSKSASNDSLGGFTFKKSKELFSGPPYADFSLTLGEHDQPAMLWSYTYKKGQWSWAMGNFPNSVSKSARHLSFEIISNREGPIFLQVIEEGGEAFYATLNPTSDWASVRLELSSLQVDPEKKKNGKLEINKIKSLLLADGASEGKTIKGQRDVYITAPTFSY